MRLPRPKLTGVMDVPVVHEDGHEIGVGGVDVAAPELAGPHLAVLAGQGVGRDTDLGSRGGREG